MKRTILFSILMLTACALTLDAQVAVTAKGQLKIGRHQEKSFSGEPVDPVPGAVNPLSDSFVVGPELGKVDIDTCSQIVVLGNGYQNRGGYISFGDLRNVTVGEDSLVDNRLILRGADGIIYYDRYGNVFRYTDGRFRFNCPIEAERVFQTSDSRLKKNIQDLDDAYLRLEKLTGISYSLNKAEKGLLI